MADTSISIEEGEARPARIPFFRPLSRSKENTWVISVFVVIQLVVFAATMIVNDCPRRSNGDCVVASIGRLSFQPLSENPLLGPSSTTLIDMGALERNHLMEQRQMWRLFTAPWLHAGIIHLLLDLSTLIFIGIHLEQQFGSWRIGLVYVFSSFVATLPAALFVKSSPTLASSAALFGLLGAMLSALVRNWKLYSDKTAAFASFLSLAIINFALGLLPHVDNFSNLGGFLCGILLGFVLLYNPQLGQVPQNKTGLFDYTDKTSVSLKHKLDKPLIRIVSLLLFSLLFAGALVALLHGVNASNYCSWCHYIDCVPSNKWSCNHNEISCKVIVSGGRLTVGCRNNDKYHVYPFTDISPTRIRDLCSEICS